MLRSFKIFIVGLFVVCFGLVEMVYADTIVMRSTKSSEVFVLDSEDGTIRFGRFNGNYEAGDGLVAFMHNSSMYVASRESKWDWVLIGKGIDSFRVSNRLVTFRDNNKLYKVTSFYPGRHRKFTLLFDGIRDYNIYGSPQASAAVDG